jgi:hypothetical protein
MVYNAHLKFANALKTALKTPSPIIQRRKFFKFPDILSSKKTYNGHKLVGFVSLSVKFVFFFVIQNLFFIIYNI